MHFNHSFSLCEHTIYVTWILLLCFHPMYSLFIIWFVFIHILSTHNGDYSQPCIICQSFWCFLKKQTQIFILCFFDTLDHPSNSVSFLAVGYFVRPCWQSAVLHACKETGKYCGLLSVFLKHVHTHLHFSYHFISSPPH